MKSSRISIGLRNRPSGARIATAGEPERFELLCDNVGTVVFGWAARAVLYARFEGRLCAHIGQTYATRLGTLVSQSQSLSYFCDASRLQGYDYLVRTAFVGVVLSNRRKFKSMTVLTPAEGISPTMRALSETLGDLIDVLRDHDAFEERLLKAAPLVLRTSMRR